MYFFIREHSHGCRCCFWIRNDEWENIRRSIIRRKKTKVSRKQRCQESLIGSLRTWGRPRKKQRCQESLIREMAYVTRLHGSDAQT